jgi:hypothetical protein
VNLLGDNIDTIKRNTDILIGPEYVSVEGSCEHGNEPSGSIKCWEILE